MKSSRGNLVPNQFIIKTGEGEYFQSYQTVIAFKPYSGEVQLCGIALSPPPAIAVSFPERTLPRHESASRLAITSWWT